MMYGKSRLLFGFFLASLSSVRWLESILKDIHWVIVGGESGRGARPMKSNGFERSLGHVESKMFHFSSNSGVESAKT